MQSEPRGFPVGSHTFLLPGEVGLLEVSTTWLGDAGTLPDKVGIICHPHPLMGGTMHNKVVTTLGKALTETGYAVLRFNYRGVGQSEGSYGNSVGESHDLFVIMEWVQRVCPEASIALAGFSFGAFIALNGAVKEPAVTHLLSVAPAVHNQDYPSLSQQIQCPWQIIMGIEDEVVSWEAVVDWYRSVAHQASLLLLPKTGHFFHGQLLVLRDYAAHFFR